MSDKSSLQTDEAVKEPMDTQSEFGEKMIQWRENAGLNRKEFARKLNVSLTAVKNWETGHSTPKATKYSEIAKVLGINVCLLYTSPSPRDKRQSRMPSSA